MPYELLNSSGTIRLKTNNFNFSVNGNGTIRIIGNFLNSPYLKFQRKEGNFLNFSAISQNQNLFQLIFGINAYQDENILRINKNQLQGLTPLIVNSGEALLTGILNNYLLNKSGKEDDLDSVKLFLFRNYFINQNIIRTELIFQTLELAEYQEEYELL